MSHDSRHSRSSAPASANAEVEQLVARLNAHAPAVIRTLGGRVSRYAPERLELGMDFDIGAQFCHSVDIVQGGLVTAMLDAAMAHVLMASQPARVRIASIDIHVNFLRTARAGGFSALASVVKAGQSVAFVKAELHARDGPLVATATSSAQLRHPGSAAAPARG